VLVYCLIDKSATVNSATSAAKVLKRKTPVVVSVEVKINSLSPASTV